MCLDIQLRELSGGKRGILSLMQDLSNEFGSQNHLMIMNYLPQ